MIAHNITLRPHPVLPLIKVEVISAPKSYILVILIIIIISLFLLAVHFGKYLIDIELFACFQLKM